jgi:hypothetical protein
MNATHVPLHRAQERGFFNGGYGNDCYLPLYMPCGQDLPACVRSATNRVPASAVTPLLDQSRGIKRRLFDRFDHAAGGEDRPRRVIAPAGARAAGRQAGFVVTSVTGDARHLFNKCCRARGVTENFIEEAQLNSSGRRANSHRF